MNPVGTALYLKEYQGVLRFEFFLNSRNKVIRNYHAKYKMQIPGEKMSSFISKYSLLLMALKGEA